MNPKPSTPNLFDLIFFRGHLLLLSIALACPIFVPVAFGEGRHVSQQIAHCHLLERDRPVKLTYWKNEGYPGVNDEEGVHLGNTDRLKPEIGIAISNPLGRLKLKNTPEKFEVKRMDLGVGTNLRGQISINKLSGKGKINFRYTICDFKGCGTQEMNDFLEECRFTDTETII